MRLFWELTRVSFQRHLTYRAATIAGLITNLFFGLLRVAVLIALYGSQKSVAGISIEGAITFTGLSQAVIAYLSIFGWYDVMKSVYSGEVAADLLKPMSYFSFWLARDIGRAMVNFLLRGLSIMVIYMFIFNITVPNSIWQWISVFITLILGLLVSFSWRFLVNLSAFWTPNAVGIGRFAFGMAWIMSGFFMPLRFFPIWFINLCYLTPFPSMVNTIIEAYLGILDSTGLWQAILQQLLWFMVLVVLSHFTLKAGVKRLVIQGG